jgi:flagellar basal-body rod protein FlgG
MDSGLRTSASGMRAQQIMVDTISNNLANVNTTGFKRSSANFEDLLYETLQGPRTSGGPNGNGQTVAPVQVGKGVRLAGINRLDTQGATTQTGRDLDLAINGPGFFQVQRPDGTLAYTRDGTFTLSDTGALVTSGGYPVLPGVTVPPDTASITVSAGGIVTSTSSAGGQAVEIGKLELARFVNPTGLQAIGENQYTETAASGRPQTGTPQQQGFGQVLSGYLESSNVEIVVEMTDMIAAQRAYEINSKAITANEQMAQSTNDLIR